MRSKVTVVGAGNVGATTAQRIHQLGYADVVLVDVVEDLPERHPASAHLLDVLMPLRRCAKCLETFDFWWNCPPVVRRVCSFVLSVHVFQHGL